MIVLDGRGDRSGGDGSDWERVDAGLRTEPEASTTKTTASLSVTLTELAPARSTAMRERRVSLRRTADHRRQTVIPVRKRTPNRTKGAANNTA